MFELTRKENQSLRSQNVTLKRGQHSKYLPFAFTEQGVAMLSSVPNTERAIDVNIEIMRAFVRLRQMLALHKDLERKLVALERRGALNMQRARRGRWDEIRDPWTVYYARHG